MTEQASARTSAFEQGSFVRKSASSETTSQRKVRSNRLLNAITCTSPMSRRTAPSDAGFVRRTPSDVVDWRMQTTARIFNPDEPGATTACWQHLAESYAAAAPSWTSSPRIGTVPVMWDCHRHHRQQRPRNCPYDDHLLLGSRAHQRGVLCPRSPRSHRCDDRRELRTGEQRRLQSGFARSQSAYDTAVDVLLTSRRTRVHLEGRDWLVGKDKAC